MPTAMPSPAASQVPRVSPTASAPVLDRALAGLTFARPGDSETEIFVVDGAGVPQRILGVPADASIRASGSTEVWGPMWAPDGSALAVGVGMPPLTTLVVDAVGEAPRQLAGCGILVGWSPDSRQILTKAFSDMLVPEPAPSRPCAVDLGTGELTELTLPPVTRWLPDGSFLFIGGDPATQASVAYRVDGKTGTLTRLLEADEVAWSPKGDQLAYSRWVPALGISELGIAKADGSGQQAVGSGLQPTWSPDGRFLAYQELVDNGPTSRLRMVAEDGQPVSVPDLVINGGNPAVAWAPDSSRYVVWVGDPRIPESRLVAVDLGGQVTDLGEGSWPIWRPTDQ